LSGKRGLEKLGAFLSLSSLLLADNFTRPFNRIARNFVSVDLNAARVVDEKLRSVVVFENRYFVAVDKSL